MTTQNIGLFKAIGAKMDYLNQRQRIIAQNIANSDTPGYLPTDLTPVDFGRVLKGIEDKSKLQVRLDTTAAGHMPPANKIADPRAKEQRHNYEVAPAGNAVIMEEQLINANRTAADYNLLASLLEKNVGMIRTALGNRG